MIYLLRHGQTEYNIEGRYQGASDSPLTALGRSQAQAFGAQLAKLTRPRAIWTSPLLRARATADLLAAPLNLTPQTDDRLAEVSLGQWDGMTRAEIAVGWPDARRRHPPRQWMFHAPGGERLDALLDRLRAVLDDARTTDAAAEASGGGDLVLVSHGITGRLMRGIHSGLPLAEALTLEARQDMIWRLHPEGLVEGLPSTGLL